MLHVSISSLGTMTCLLPRAWPHEIISLATTTKVPIPCQNPWLASILCHERRWAISYVWLPSNKIFPTTITSAAMLVPCLPRRALVHLVDEFARADTLVPSRQRLNKSAICHFSSRSNINILYYNIDTIGFLVSQGSVCYVDCSYNPNTTLFRSDDTS